MLKSLDLLLVNPSGRKKIYQAGHEASHYPAIETPYLALLTAQFARKHRYDVKILDANAEGLSADEAAARAHEYNPRLTQVIVQGNQPSASTQLMPYVGNFATILKAQGNHSIIVSGVHPSALPVRTLREENVDFVAQGEGFYAPIDLLKGTKPSKARGVWFKKDGGIFRGRLDQRMSSEELAENFPTAAWNLIDPANYRAHDWQCLDNLDARQPYAAIYTSFGCPMTCDFCCINAPFDNFGTIKHTLTFRKPEDVVAEIKLLHEEHGVRKFKFPDEMYIFDQRHYIPIAEGIIREGLGDKIDIWAYARVDTVREGHLDILRKAGFTWYGVGIEAGNEEIRQGASKGKFKDTKVFEVVRAIEKAGSNVIGNYMFGLRGDTMETMKQTLNLATELNCMRPNLYCVIPYPGSDIHRDANSGNWPVPEAWDYSRPLLPENEGGPGWLGYSQHNAKFLPVPTATLFPEQILEFRDNAVRWYFLENQRYREKIEKAFGRETMECFCEMNAPEFERDILKK